jgi:hypothetical protein
MNAQEERRSWAITARAFARSTSIGRSIKFLISTADKGTVARSPKPHAPIAAQAAAALLTAAVMAGCGGGGNASPQASSTVARQPVASHSRTTHHTRSQHAAKGTSAAPAKAKKSSTKHDPSAARPTAVTHPVVHSKQPVIAAGAVSRVLTGTGNMAIGTLSENTTVVLEWSATGPPIQIFNPHGFLLVNSSSPTGRVRLARGVYKDLRVAAKGHWTIQVRAY